MRLALGRARALLCAVVGLFGCSSSPALSSEPQALSNAKIIGGTEDDGDPAIVAVQAMGATGGGLCTGEIIAPGWVLTASHCVDDATLKVNVTSVTITMAPNVQDQDPSNSIEAAAWYVHPQYDKDSGANDVALVQLSQQVDVTPLPFVHRPIDRLNGAQARAVGYGRTVDGDSNSAGPKVTADFTITDMNPTDFLLSSPSASQCHGDSGGPTLVVLNGTETIVGIGWHTVDTNGLCDQGVRDHRIDIHAEWIETVMASGTSQ
jgi:secreted trypsin-like serine protease